MRLAMLLTLGLPLMGCSSSSSGGSSTGPDASGTDATSDATSNDGGNGQDATGNDAAGNETGSGGDAGDGGGGGEDASDGGSCPASWLVVPPFDPKLDVPLDGGGVVLLHAAGVGMQNYACVPPTDGGGASWVLLGPSAALNDCRGTLIGHHFPSEGGAGYPEWQTLDGTYVVGHKQQAVTPEGGAGSVPWLLLQAVDAGGTGTLSQVAYIQRLDTDGGLAPVACDDAGAMIQIPYSADYFFYGP
jgi:hypothetical protein